MNKNFSFNFRRQSVSTLPAMLQDGIHPDSFDYLVDVSDTEKGKDVEVILPVERRAEATFIRRKTVEISVPVVTLDEVKESPKGEFILSRLLNDFSYALVRKDFDKAEGNVLPSDYAITVDYLADCLSPSATTSAKKYRIKNALLAELAKSFANYLLSIGRKPQAIQFQLTFFKQQFAPEVMATVTEDKVTAIAGNLIGWAEGLSEAEASAYKDAIEVLQGNIAESLENREVVEADDL